MDTNQRAMTMKMAKTWLVRTPMSRPTLSTTSSTRPLVLSRNPIVNDSLHRFRERSVS
jgi:hypothetical protein